MTMMVMIVYIIKWLSLRLYYSCCVRNNSHINSIFVYISPTESLCFKALNTIKQTVLVSKITSHKKQTNPLLGENSLFCLKIRSVLKNIFHNFQTNLLSFFTH